MNNRKTPRIRFKGFTDDWEQRKLGELFNFHYGDGNNNPSNGGKYPVFGAGGIQGGYTKYNAENSVIIGHMGDAGCVSWGEGKHFVTYNGTITKPKDEVFSAKFGYYLLLNMNLRKYRGGSGLPFLTYDMLTEMETRCTNSKIETQKIADYFTHLDHLITLHQRKLEKLKIVKKAMLENCFPKNGEKVPKFRFSGFTGDWEQRKLGNEVIEILAGGDINKIKIVEDGKYPIYANALTNCGIVGYYDDYYRVKAPAVTVTGRGEVGLAQARMTDFTPVVRLLAIRSNHDCYFLENAINNHKVVVESTGVPQLTVPQLSSYSIFFPKNIEEETRIGEYFRSLDQLITLHHRKLEKLKLIKKSFLEKMFV